MSMSAELYALVAACLVQMAAIALAGKVMNRELGFSTNAGPRDHLPEFSPLLSRLRRAVVNGFEGLALFAPACLLIALTAQSTAVTMIAAWLYVAARVLYIPAYAYGWSPGRSYIWGLGTLSTLTLLGSAVI